MKKALSFILVLAMVLSLVACGGGSSQSPEAKKVAEYVAANKADLISGMEYGIATSSGLTCTSSVKAEGTGIVISININELEDIDSNTKAQMQAAYDQQVSVFEALLTQLQGEIPEVTYFTVRVCEKDGDLLATIKAGK